MKCMVVVYINSEGLINDIEGIMRYNSFSAIESNQNFRVFMGYFEGGPVLLAKCMNRELADSEFDKEDSIFIAFAAKKKTGSVSISNIIIKRKGNTSLREDSLFR